MGFTENEKMSIRLYVEPITKAMVEQKFELVQALRGRLAEAILSLRPELFKGKIEHAVAEAVGNLTETTINQDSADIEHLVDAIMKRLTTAFR